MSNRRFEMYQHRQVIVRMRLGESDRTIARAGLMGRRKAADLREIAHEQGWLSRGTQNSPLVGIENSPPWLLCCGLFHLDKPCL